MNTIQSHLGSSLILKAMAFCSALSFLAPLEAKDLKSTSSKIPEKYQQIQFAPFDYQTPQAEKYRYVLSDRAVAYLFPHNDLPLLHITVGFLERNTSAWADTNTAYGFLSSMYKNGGSARFSPQTVEDSLEFLSSQWGVSLGNRQSQLSFDIMAKDLETVLNLVQDIVLNPRIDSTRLDILKKNSLQSLAHRYDAAPAVSSDLFDKILYNNHPFFKPTPISSIQKVDRSFLLSLAQRPFRAPKIIIGVSGKFDIENMKQTLNQWNAQWPKPEKRSLDPTLKEPVALPTPGIYAIDRPATQAQIRIGAPFLQRPNPEYYPATIAAYILGGGGFTSRLVARVRTDEGLAYHIGANVANNYFYAGPATINTQTKVESAARSLQLIQEELKKFTEKGPTAQELQNAKDGIISSLPSMFDTPENTVDAFISNEINGRSADYYSKFPDSIRAVTAEQVRLAAQKYFDWNKMAITLVGPKEKLLAPDPQWKIKLEDFGKVNWLKIEDLTP